MANIELIIEKLESLGFIEVVLSTKKVFWQKENIKVQIQPVGDESVVIVSKNFPKELDLYLQIDLFILDNLENIAQW